MLTLKEKLQEIIIDEPDAIPWTVRFLENPRSFFALPGKISLYNHDCLHALLNRKTTLQDEAFLIGFCMGNDPQTQFFHIWIFKFFCQYLYPKSYRFNDQDFFYFDLGFAYGKSLKVQFNLIEFSNYSDIPLSILRQEFGIKDKHLNWINSIEH